MIIKIDSREQAPLEFKVGDIVKEVRVEGLPFADYWGESDDGYEYPIVFERKGLGDLFGTLTGGMDRFKRMLEKADAVQAQVYLLIEGSLEKVYKGYEHSQVSGDQIVRTIFSLKVRHGLEPIFCNSRHEMKAHIVETYEALERNYAKVKASSEA